MKKQLTLLSFLFTLTTIFSQEYRKYWSDGKLTWNDFQGKYTKKSSTNLAYMLVYQTDKKVIDNVVYHGLFSDAYIDKSLSFLHPNLQTQVYLDYNQVIFNLIELSKRALQQKLYLLDNVYQSNSLLMDSKNQLEKKIFDFQEASDYGLQSGVTKQWLTKTTQELSSSATFVVPDYKKSNWTYGMYGGLDFGIHQNEYQEIFNNTLAFSLGFEFSYKKVFFLLNMSVTNSKLNKDLQDDTFYIPKGEKSTITMLNFAAGYPVYESEKLKVMPFAGYGMTAFGKVGKHTNNDEIISGTSIFGVNLDFKDRKRVNFTPSLFNIREEGNSYIRTRIFVANSNFNPTLKGYSIHIGISYGFEGRLLSKK